MNQSIGDKIKRLRTEKKISQEALAKALYFSNRTISNWENNLREVSVSNLQKIAKFFQVPLSYFTEDKAPALPINGAYQQVKAKKIAVSDRFYYVLLILIIVNAAFFWIPLQNRISFTALLLIFWIGFLITTIVHYTNLDRQRTKAFFVALESRIMYVTNLSLAQRKQFKFHLVMQYSLLLLVSLIYAIGIFGMFNRLGDDIAFNSLIVGFYLFMTMIEIFVIVRELIKGVTPEMLPYAKEQNDFGMIFHRAVASMHYAMVIFLNIYLNAFGHQSFPLDLLLFTLVNGLVLILLLRMILVTSTRFYDSYRIIIEDPASQKAEKIT